MKPFASFRDFLYRSLKDRPEPVFLTDDRICPAASLWAGTRLVTEEIRNSDLKPEDLVCLHAEPGIRFLESLFASMWTGLKLVILPPGHSPDEAGLPVNAVFQNGKPVRISGNHKRIQGNLPHSGIILMSSGTSGKPKPVWLTEKSILSVLNSHIPRMEMTGRRVLSVLPWHHSFGLVLELLAAVAEAEMVIRSSSGSKNTDAIVKLGRQTASDYMHAVPLIIYRMIESGHSDFIQSLSGGIVGGAEITDKNVLRVLQNSKLRAGYGQTEASPGIMLGDAGEWSSAFIGRPLGCEVKVIRGELMFSGDNACAGIIRDGTFTETTAWTKTGDLVSKTENGYRFEGRLSDNFKLRNGTFLEVQKLEQQISDSTDLPVIIRKSAGSDGMFDVCILDRGEHPNESIANIRKYIKPDLQKYLNQILLIPSAEAMRTPKGSMDRKKLTA